MCGIIGYIGKKEAIPFLLNGLKKLEYRGYDSSGIAIKENDKDFLIVKSEGKVENLCSKLNSIKCNAKIGIGHTRWATHGNCSEKNAHPHYSDDYNVVGVHNGIIENYKELKRKLIDTNYVFYSDTDTEILIKLIDYYYKKYKLGPIDAINRSMVRSTGSYSIVLMFKDYPDRLYFAKKGSPLIISKIEEGFLIASDISPIVSLSNKAYYVDDNQCGYIDNDAIHFFDLNGLDITFKKESKNIDVFENDNTELKGFEHYMLKEIYEQPKAIEETLKNNSNINPKIFEGVNNLLIVACGSSYYAGIIGKNVIEKISNVSVNVEISSEFLYNNCKLRDDTIAVFISQSGETKDTCEAIKKAKEKGIKTVAICNVKNSLLSRLADYTIYTYAGIEIAVATTKAFSCQLIVMYLIALLLSDKKYEEELEILKMIPKKIQDLLENLEEYQRIANEIFNDEHIFFVGRGLDYSVCLEGALKLKEISYINANSYPAGELKHGPIALINSKSKVIVLNTQKDLYLKMCSTVEEIKARGGKVIIIGKEIDDYESILIPDFKDIYSASLSIIPLQVISYYASVFKGINPDKPRNLAKSVTVE